MPKPFKDIPVLDAKDAEVLLGKLASEMEQAQSEEKRKDKEIELRELEKSFVFFSSHLFQKMYFNCIITGMKKDLLAR